MQNIPYFALIPVMDLYFDNAATTRLSEAALKAYIDTEREFFANPSSIHREGMKAHKELERLRENMASLLSVPASSLFFTSGATESIATVFSSLLMQDPGKVIISAIEHEAVASWLRVLEAHGWKTARLKAKGGFIRKEDLEAELTPDTKLVAIMAVNNVTGAIEDIKGLVETVREYEKRGRRRIFFFSDSVQALGKIPYDIAGLGIDGASFSAHKINGPRGIGMLYLRRPESFTALSSAGGQEKGKRGGTENLPAIAGFSAALREWLSPEQLSYLDFMAPRFAEMPRRRKPAGIKYDAALLRASVASYFKDFYDFDPSKVRICQGRIPLTCQLLSPRGIAVQTTSDLANFWDNGWPQVKKELKARYPKHFKPGDMR